MSFTCLCIHRHAYTYVFVIWSWVSLLFMYFLFACSCAARSFVYVGVWCNLQCLPNARIVPLQLYYSIHQTPSLDCNNRAPFMTHESRGMCKPSLNPKTLSPNAGFCSLRTVCLGDGSSATASPDSRGGQETLGCTENEDISLRTYTHEWICRHIYIYMCVYTCCVHKLTRK